MGVFGDMELLGPVVVSARGVVGLQMCLMSFGACASVWIVGSSAAQGHSVKAGESCFFYVVMNWKTIISSAHPSLYSFFKIKQTPLLQTFVGVHVL